MTTKGHHRQIWFTCFTGEDSNLSENQKQNQKMAKASMPLPHEIKNCIN